MCGILGAYSREGVLPEPERFTCALDIMRNRGPDDFGLWADSQVRLGHRRLAIVDLSQTGHQPMLSSDGRYVITFNGEIYNHAALRPELNPMGGWRGGSDTETLLESYAAWGPACLDRLIGMFAFAIWDQKERRLFAARDRMGVKPFYYSWLDGRLDFASRPGPLTTLTGSKTPNPQALRLYMELGYIPAPLSFYQGVEKLKPAHYLIVDERGLKVTRYWDYRHVPPEEGLMRRSEEDLVEELDALVRDSVRLRLMSDVPFGAFLSSGTDSALVVAAMKAAGVAQPRTFTIGFREPAYDESAAANRIASIIGVEHTCEVLSIEDLLQLLPQYVTEFDEPLSDNSAFATMAVARLARRHVTVALTGDAGDELFGGYPQYRLLRRLAPMLKWSPLVRTCLSSVLAQFPWHNGKLLAGALRLRDPTALFAYMRGLSKDYKPLLSDDLIAATDGSQGWFEHYAASFATDLSEAELAMRLDMGFVLPDDFLQKVDVATMAYSLEARCPLTDHRLAEWAMRLPLSYKLRGGTTKYLLKKTLSRYLPADLIYRPKKGFSVPVSSWLRGPLRQWAAELLHDRATMDRLPLIGKHVHELFQQHVSGRRNAAPLLWTVLMLICFVARQDRDIELPHLARPRAA